jgi:hypothetical protein
MHAGDIMYSKSIGVMILSLGVLVGARVLAGEDEIRQAFVGLQKAIKARDSDKIWELIDSDSQTDAERAAKAVKAAYAKLKGKDDFEKKYGLSAKELAGMNGKLFIKSNRFHGKYYEVPDSKLESIKVKGDTGRLNYIEEDGDKQKFALVRQKGQWRFSVPMPKPVD